VRIEEPGGPDAVTLSPDRPVYQVNVYTLVSESAGMPGYACSYHVQEWKLHDADVVEVLGWAKEKAGVDPYTVDVASAANDGESYLLRLYGDDPNRGPETRDEYYTLAPDGVVPDREWFLRRAHDQGQ
jgi:hypothetical protein